MRWREAVTILAVLLCWSCAPARDVRRVPDPPVTASQADRSLLHRLALADPAEKPISAAVLAPSLARAAPPFLHAAASDADGQRATDCLTSAVYYEARSEPLDGQRAVAQVVLNRVRDRAFPASICRVVYQRSPAGCQFSFVCDGSMSHPLEPRAWQTAAGVARAALAGSVFAPVGSATHYHTVSVLPWWASSLARIGTIGSHIFYRWGNRLGGALSFRQAYSGHEVVQIASAAAAAASDTGLHAGVSDEGGVTVHRGVVAVSVGTGAGVGAGSPAVFGVRIHRGVPVAPGFAVEPPAEDDAAAG